MNKEEKLVFYGLMEQTGKIPYTGIECDSCKEKSWSYPHEKCMACGSGMNLWGDNSNE